MGKIIAKKVRGLNVWAKGLLVISLTLLASVMMYQGWYKPAKVAAAPGDTLLHNSTNLGGNTKWPNNATGWGVAGGKYGQFTCATCHSATTTNIKRIKTSIAMANFSTFNAAGTATGVTSSVNVSFLNISSMGKDPNPTATNASTRVCQACHTRTNKHNSNNQRPSVTDHAHNNATDCTGCHAHNAAFKGAGECLTCHAEIKGGVRKDVVNQFNNGNLAGNSHHIQGVTLTNAHCYQCHMEADATGNMTSYHKGSAGGSVNLVVYGANGVRGTNYISYTASLLTTGTAAQKRASVLKLNQHCLGCHNATNTSYVAGTLNVTARNYFNDGKAPNNFAWDSTKTSIDTRYSQTGTVKWINYSTVTYSTTNQGETILHGTTNKSRVKKALSAHGNSVNNMRGYSHNVANSIQELWGTNATNTYNVACYDCHNSHGSSVVGTVTSYTPATTTGGLLKDVTAGLQGYSVTYKPYSGGSAATKNKYTAGGGLCFNCHNTATSGTKTKVFAGYSSRTPWGYNDTFGASAPIYGYQDTPYFAPGTSGSLVRYSYKNLAGSSTQKGGHLGVSSTLSAALDGARAGGTSIGGICTECHDPHGVTTDTTKVTNTQYGIPLLKGNWMSSPYREDAAPASTTKTRGGGSSQPAVAHASIPRYRIDQNTFGATTTNNTGRSNTASGTGGPSPSWTFSMPAGKITENAGQFGGLCLSSATAGGGTGCHVEANIKNTAAATTTNWKSMTRVHNTVNGWATTGGGNAANAVHAYTCSKCHAPHTSNLPRLLVTNCLDWKHRSLAATGGSIAATQTVTNGSANARTGNVNQGQTGTAMGAGRFPGGGGRYYATQSGVRSSNAGPWFFGTKQPTGGTATTGWTYSARPCHDSATAGGTYTSNGTNYPTSELWNTKSTW